METLSHAASLVDTTKDIPTVTLYPAGGGFNGLRLAEKYHLDDLLDEFMDDYSQASIKSTFVEEVILKQIKIYFWEGNPKTGHRVEPPVGEMARKIQQRMRDLRKKRKLSADPEKYPKPTKKKQHEYVQFDNVGRRIKVSKNDDTTVFGSVIAVGYKVQLDNGEEILVDASSQSYSWLPRYIEQIDLLDGSVVNEFESVQKAYKAIGKDSKADIEKVLTGEVPSAGGYFWRFKGTTTMPNCDDRPVQQLSVDKKGQSKVNKTFDTIKQAAKAVKKQNQELQILESLIKSCCWGHTTDSVAGYKWQFAPPPKEEEDDNVMVSEAI